MQEIHKLDLRDAQVRTRVFPLVVQLRTHLTPETFATLAAQMIQENYELWAYQKDGQILGLASSRRYTDFPRGPHLYVDDLMTHRDFRSRGIGAALLKHLEKYAQEQGLTTLRLSCVIENEGGMKFYRREGWKERAYALVKKV